MMETASHSRPNGAYHLPISVRLLASKGGIDTPELGGRAKCQAERKAAARARDFTQSAIEESGGRVWLRRVRHDKYGGRIDADARVLIAGRKQSLGDMLIRTGLARPYSGKGARPNWCAILRKER